jgi:hypothetical protein
MHRELPPNPIQPPIPPEMPPGPTSPDEPTLPDPELPDGHPGGPDEHRPPV